MTSHPQQPNPDRRGASHRERQTSDGTSQPDKLVRMEQAMLALPRMTREVFLAHRLDGYSYTDIARLTGMSVHRVERHMATAIYHLSRFMDGDERTPWQRRWQSLLPRWRC
ncbi:sigma-70 region 4 domain-containing protein [Sphingomonas sp. PB4P5]|uniref:sigma-70 region 4 domain-containing protein n=1 Tax=Parasphingomonas puruogangriensis TaxID=3096155 RepID=UPI002FCBF80F